MQAGLQMQEDPYFLHHLQHILVERGHQGKKKKKKNSENGHIFPATKSSG